MKYLYDANIIIYHLGNEKAVERFFTRRFLDENEVATNSIVRIELLSFSELDKEEERKIRELLDQFEVIPLTSPIEELTIGLRRASAIKIPDAIIAATALALGATLVTRNTDDFSGIQGLELLNPFLS